MLERLQPSVLVVNPRPLWIRLLFRELGKFVPTTGVTFHLGSEDAPVTEIELAEAPGWSLVPMRLPRRSFGRLAPLFAPWIHRQLIKNFGRPRLVVFTQPSQRCLCGYFADTRQIYYVADDYRWGYGYEPDSVETWERIIVNHVEHVVCVSKALAQSIVERYRLSEDRISVSANGMPASLIPENGVGGLGSPLETILPEVQPLAGVLGTINRRVRLDWLRAVVDELSWLNLLLVGSRTELSDEQLEDWRYLAGHSRCTIVGPVDYYELFRYAARVEIGLIPLTNDGINPASSPTRFFTQLPFGQPIVASESSLQLREFEPLVSIVSTLPEFIQKVEALYRVDFDDELADRRRETARRHTWEGRAERFFQELVCQQS